MRIKKFPYDWEFDVFCRQCKKIIVVEEPKDLTKLEEDRITKFHLVCPNCANEIWFDNLTGHRINPDFIKQVKNYEPTYLDLIDEACKKFNEDFEGTFDDR